MKNATKLDKIVLVIITLTALWANLIGKHPLQLVIVALTAVYAIVRFIQDRPKDDGNNNVKSDDTYTVLSDKDDEKNI